MIEKYQKLDSVDELLTIETTIIKKLMTEESYHQSVQKLAKDIENKNQTIVEKIKKLKNNQKQILIEAVFNWDYDTDYYGIILSQTLYGFALSMRPKQKISRGEFHDLLKEVSSEKIFDLCYYNKTIKNFKFKSRWDNDRLYLTIFNYDYAPYNVILKVVYKFYKRDNTIKLCYIEPLYKKYSKYSPEAISFIKKYYFNESEEIYDGPTFFYNKKYKDVVLNAIKKKYLKGIKVIHD